MSSFYQVCDYFEFLDDLRSSGKANMFFDAAPILAKSFGLDQDKARSILQKWQDTFSTAPLEDRVSEAQRTV